MRLSHRVWVLHLETKSYPCQHLLLFRRQVWFPDGRAQYLFRVTGRTNPNRLCFLSARKALRMVFALLSFLLDMICKPVISSWMQCQLWRLVANVVLRLLVKQLLLHMLNKVQRWLIDVDGTSALSRAKYDRKCKANAASMVFVTRSKASKNAHRPRNTK